MFHRIFGGGRIRRLWPLGGGSGTAPITYDLLTESGNKITTEAGAGIEIEAGP